MAHPHACIIHPAQVVGTKSKEQAKENKMHEGYNLPAQVSVIKSQLEISDATFLAEYGERMVEAAEAGIESQRRWTLYHMGSYEQRDEAGNKEWVRDENADPVKIPEAVFGLRARMFSRLQEGVSHMAQLKPKRDCPVPEDEMRHIAHALGHEFSLSQMRKNGRGYYVDACLSPKHNISRVGMEGDEYERHRKNPDNVAWIDEDYRAHLGYKAVLLAAARDLGEIPPDPAQEGKGRRG